MKNFMARNSAGTVGEEAQPVSNGSLAKSLPSENAERTALRLLSRSARHWKLIHEADKSPSGGKTMKVSFDIDFSEVTTAADFADDWLRMGEAVALVPDRASVSGTYFIADSRGNKVAVFKPVDEEAGQQANPLDEDLFDGYSKAFVLGECAYKEAAAYIVDHNNNSGVPQTVIVKSNVPFQAGKSAPSGNGAFQVFHENLGDADDFGSGLFSVENVQRIAVFDMRVLNCDRHGGNMLVTKKSDGLHQLIPIDHGYILPDQVVTPSWPAWMHFPQVKQPLHPAVKRYVLSIDCAHDVDMLVDELGKHLHQGSTRTLRMTTYLLQKGVEIGMSLYDIGLLIFSSGRDNSKSFLEKVADEAFRAGLARERQIESNDDLVSLQHHERPSHYFRASTEDFIVRYASKLIDKHMHTLGGFTMSMSRARSNPNFYMHYMHVARRESVQSRPVQQRFSAPINRCEFAERARRKTIVTMKNSSPVRN